MKLSIIIPAYNEAAGITQTAAALRPVLAQLRQKFDLEVIFINDGSRDATEKLLRQEFAQDAGTQVISHPKNRGLGGALRTGFQNATGDIVVTTDFDGTYSFESIPKIVDQLLRDDVDIVSASPYHPLGKVEGVPPYRLMFSFGASLLYRLLVQWDIYCWTALFRAYRRSVLQKVSFESDDFLAGTELLVNALLSGFRASEFPTVLRVRSFGQSSMKIARVTMAHLKFQSRLFKQTSSYRIQAVAKMTIASELWTML